MAGNINWLGNKVVDPNSSRPSIASSVNKTSPMQTQQLAVSVQDTDVPAQIPPDQQGPPPITEPGYIPYYLTTNIGKIVRAEFILGTSQYVDKSGRLIEVGINYFVLEDINSHAHIMCDLYSVKFVTVVQNRGNIVIP